MKIGIAGCSGRMARRVIRAAAEFGDCEIVGGFARSGSSVLGCDLGVIVGLSALGVKATDDPETLFRAAEVVVDFTNPSMLQTHVDQAVQHRTALVIGTTGLTLKHEEFMRFGAERTPILHSPNTSLGINLLLGIVERLASILTPERGFDVAIVDQHHRHKLDAPSGTALALQRAAGTSDQASAQPNSATSPTAVVSLRLGDIAGDHTVILAGPGERLELTHRASDPSIFARGALLAARWLVGRPNGLYDMRQVLDLT